MSWYSLRTWWEQVNARPPIRASDANRWEQALDRLAGAAPLAAQTLKSGQWYVPGIMGMTGTSAGVGNGNLRVCPVPVRSKQTFNAIAVAVTAAGSTGAVLRPAVYADDGTGYPGALVLDPGTLDATAIANPSATVALTLTPGLYFVGAVLQGAPSTQPTVVTGSAPVTDMPWAMGTSAPGTTSPVGYIMSSVTGALPSTFSTSVTPTGVVPRVALKAV